jgi:FAD/FMN-containing dehydrogenase
MNNYTERYWGENSDKLIEIKTKYDPTNVFGCHNCITSSEVNTSLF